MKMKRYLLIGFSVLIMAAVTLHRNPFYDRFCLSSNDEFRRNVDEGLNQKVTLMQWLVYARKIFVSNN